MIIEFVKGKVKIPLALVVPITVVPLDRLYSLFAFNTQPVCSEGPPEQLAVVQAIRLVPSATRALYAPPPEGLSVELLQKLSNPLIPKFVLNAGKVLAVTNILQGPVVEHGPTEVFVVEEVELLLFATSARALAAAVLSVLFSKHDMSEKQIKLTMIKLTIEKEFDKSFSFCKKILQNKGNTQSCSIRVDFFGNRVNLF